MLLYLSVKPYTLKFLTRHLGRDYQLSNVDSFGRYLFGLLRQPRNDKQYDNYLSRYTAKFPVRLVPYLLADRACKNCSSQTVVHFNNFVEEIFFREFRSFVQFRVQEEEMQAKVAIEKFSRFLGLTEDDISFETLKKNWCRYWKKEKKRLESEQTPSGLSLVA
ncbi:MAG: hypothetical protein EOO57_10630 [Hymenobacter sp.]|nr:MAG: hypothetical protein EOO57_10630 [Hymenobacter sp.]